MGREDKGSVEQNKEGAVSESKGEPRAVRATNLLLLLLVVHLTEGQRDNTTLPVELCSEQLHFRHKTLRSINQAGVEHRKSDHPSVTKEVQPLPKFTPSVCLSGLNVTLRSTPTFTGSLSFMLRQIQLSGTATFCSISRLL